MAVDPQGFVRAQWRAKDDSILLKRWTDEGLLQRFSVFKSTAHELQSFSGISDTLKALDKIIENGPEVAVATMGEEGSLLMTKSGKVYRVPVSELGVKRDDMGAGDCFSTGLFCEYLDGRDPLWCASMGSALASCILETVGPTIEASLEEIRERAEVVFNGINRLH
jgi:sugar/nucleoside kinase (ribokinase family)